VAIILFSAFVVIVANPWLERVTSLVAVLGTALFSGLFIGAFALLRNRR